MKRTALLTLALLILPAIAVADSHDATIAEVKKTVEDNLAATRAAKQESPSVVSEHGSLEFWSSGGLLTSSSPDADPQDFEIFNLHPKHIEVIPLADGVAVAMYYMEGTMQPKGFPVVSNYRTRVMTVYVKEDGAWKQRAGHWSALGGGSGTSQTVE